MDNRTADPKAYGAQQRSSDDSSAPVPSDPQDYSARTGESTAKSGPSGANDRNERDRSESRPAPDEDNRRSEQRISVANAIAHMRSINLQLDQALEALIVLLAPEKQVD